MYACVSTRLSLETIKGAGSYSPSSRNVPELILKAAAPALKRSVPLLPQRSLWLCLKLPLSTRQAKLYTHSRPLQHTRITLSCWAGSPSLK